jgi:hypothetical protein
MEERKPENQPTQFVVIQECSNGNESVGDMWLDTRTFPPTATLAEVWAAIAPGGNASGRTMLRPDESSARTPFNKLF